MQKYMTNFMDPIHWQLDHCSSNWVEQQMWIIDYISLAASI